MSVSPKGRGMDQHAQGGLSFQTVGLLPAGALGVHPWGLGGPCSGHIGKGVVSNAAELKVAGKEPLLWSRQPRVSFLGHGLAREVPGSKSV